jgi:hypothetical protein
MPRFALIKKNALVEVREYAAQPPDIEHKGVKWLPFVEEYPDIQAATQKLEAKTTTIEAERVYKTAAVYTFTAAELLAAAESKTYSKIGELQSGANSAIFKTLFAQENRILALEGKAEISVEEFKTALRSLL